MKYLLVGPLIEPVHGQSIAFTRFVESISQTDKDVIDTNLEDKPKINKLALSFILLIKIAMKVLMNRYDVVYFTCSRSLLGSIKDILLINLASVNKVSKIVNHLHGSDFYFFINKCPKWYRYLLLMSYTKVNTSVVLLEQMKEQFKDFPDMNIEVVSNFYDRELGNQRYMKDGNVINLVYLSNIMYSKGIFELLDAYKELSLKYKHLRLTIAGSYIADKYMSISDVESKFLYELNLCEGASYIGKVAGEKKVKILQESDIFILPTYYESEAFPISIIEAMAAGNAIVTTNFKYLPYIVSGETGILVEPMSVASLSDGVEILIKDKPRLCNMKEHNKHIAKETYSLETYIESLKKIIN